MQVAFEGINILLLPQAPNLSLLQDIVVMEQVGWHSPKSDFGCALGS